MSQAPQRQLVLPAESAFRTAYHFGISKNVAPFGGCLGPLRLELLPSQSFPYTSIHNASPATCYNIPPTGSAMLQCSPHRCQECQHCRSPGNHTSCFYRTDDTVGRSNCTNSSFSASFASQSGVPPIAASPRLYLSPPHIPSYGSVPAQQLEVYGMGCHPPRTRKGPSKSR